MDSIIFGMFSLTVYKIHIINKNKKLLLYRAFLDYSIQMTILGHRRPKLPFKDLANLFNLFFQHGTRAILLTLV